MDTSSLRLFGRLWLAAGLAMLLVSAVLALAAGKWLVFSLTAPYGLGGCLIGLLFLGAAARLADRRAS